jgi:FlaA1/EpsC-like NDP-sugar epimerase
MPHCQRLLNIAFAVRSRPGLYRWTLRGVQLGAILIASLSSFLLRFDLTVPMERRVDLLVFLSCCTVAKVLVFHRFRLDRAWWRYISVSDLAGLMGANIVGSGLSAVGFLFFNLISAFKSLFILDFLLCCMLTAGLRLGVRAAFEFSRGRKPRGGKRTLIYGAGDAGATLVREISRNPDLAYDVIGFVDDAPQLKGRRIHGAKVFGRGTILTALVNQYAVETVLIAMPSATSPQMSVVLDRCHAAGVACKTVPGLSEVIKSSSLTAQIRDVAVEDLLGRQPVAVDEAGVGEKLQGEVVLVTGAAGSIGSELCRQIARFRPASIVGYECSETALFFLQREINENFPGVPFHAEIGDIRNVQRLADVLDCYRPSILYHAAAYKHVPMMEQHPFEAVENNIIGTWNVAVAAARYSVRDFVLISSDKAVRPANIMGATKRIAELLIRSLQNGGPRYVSVRFGNVLGSNGSVVPIFKQLIAARKPITITHSEMRRYFMTIPEASQLVLQASTLGSGGEIFVLDMGKPVRILDLARNMIVLSGLHPDQDIPIHFTGIRPGEKLCEELSLSEEEYLSTPLAKIKILVGNVEMRLPIATVIDRFRRLCATRDHTGLLLLLKELVPEYTPSTHALRRSLQSAPEYSLPETTVA